LRKFWHLTGNLEAPASGSSRAFFAFFHPETERPRMSRQRRTGGFCPARFVVESFFPFFLCTHPYFRPGGQVGF
jgi:hypothetical protein